MGTKNEFHSAPTWQHNFFGLFVSRVEPVLSSEDRVEGLCGSFSLLLLGFFVSTVVAVDVALAVIVVAVAAVVVVAVLFSVFRPSPATVRHSIFMMT